MSTDLAWLPAEYFERMKRCRGNRPVPRKLAPLEPNAFLHWVWTQMPKSKWSGPLTIEDVWWELAHGYEEMRTEDLRKSYVRIAARVRRNQRLGLDPFEGVC